MIRSIDEVRLFHDKHEIRNIRKGNGLHYRKHITGKGLYGNGLYLGEGKIWDGVKNIAKKTGEFIVNNADNVKKVVDVVHHTAKAGIDIARDIDDLNRTKELRKSQEESLRSKTAKKSEPSKTTTSSKNNNEIFKNLRLQSESIKKGKGLFYN
jgi:hypothetical protein